MLKLIQDFLCPFAHGFFFVFFSRALTENLAEWDVVSFWLSSAQKG